MPSINGKNDFKAPIEYAAEAGVIFLTIACGCVSPALALFPGVLKGVNLLISQKNPEKHVKKVLAKHLNINGVVDKKSFILDAVSNNLLSYLTGEGIDLESFTSIDDSVKELTAQYLNEDLSGELQHSVRATLNEILGYIPTTALDLLPIYERCNDIENTIREMDEYKELLKLLPDLPNLSKQIVEMQSEIKELQKPHREAQQLASTFMGKYYKALRLSAVTNAALDENLHKSALDFIDHYVDAYYEQDTLNGNKRGKEPILLSDWLIGKPLVFIKGNAGMGKSTFLEYCFAKAIIELKASTKANQPILLFIRIQDFTKIYDEGDLDFFAHIKRYLVRLNYDNDEGKGVDKFVEYIESAVIHLYLDGLDETEDLYREKLLESLKKWYFSNPNIEKIVISGRPNAFKNIDNFLLEWRDKQYVEQAFIAPFIPDQINSYIEKRVKQISFGKVSGCSDKVSALKALQTKLSVEQSENLSIMAKTPLLLSMMCELVESGESHSGLLDTTTALYEQMLKLMLINWSVKKVEKQLQRNKLSEILKTNYPKVFNEMCALAHTSFIGGAGYQSIPADLVKKTEKEIANIVSLISKIPIQHEQYLGDHCGILGEREWENGKPKTYAFLHNTFMEYLLACYCCRADDFRTFYERHLQQDSPSVKKDEKIYIFIIELLIHKPNPDWFKQLVGIYIQRINRLFMDSIENDFEKEIAYTDTGLSIRVYLDRIENSIDIIQNSSSQKRDFLDAFYFSDYYPNASVLKEFLNFKNQCFERGESNCSEKGFKIRAKMLRLIYRIESLFEEKYPLPTYNDDDWVQVTPKQLVLLGSENPDNGDEKWKRDEGIELKPYKVAVKPVCYEEFKAFADDEEGYNFLLQISNDNEPDWFKHSFSEKIKKAFRAQGEFQDGNKLFYKYNISKHPIVGVSFFDAIVYAAWLSHKHNKTYSLPSEAQWEYMAAGPDRHEYPWGSDDDPMMRNGMRSIGSTSAVGMYSNAAQAHLISGHWAAPIADVSGNVMEWCKTQYTDDGYTSEYEIDIDLPNSEMTNDTEAVLRGGCWGNYTIWLRCSSRGGRRADRRGSSCGFRLIQD